MLKRFFIVTLLCLSITGFSQKKLSLLCTGNMDAYISNEQSSVLIDRMHAQYGDDYFFPTTTLIQKIDKQLQPVAILFMHNHKDHFSSSLTSMHLTPHKKAVLFESGQITEVMKDFDDRLFTITTKNYHKQQIKVKDFKINSVKINHAGEKYTAVENVGYIVDLDTHKILRIGDTNWMEEINLFHQLALIQQQKDIAMLPYWMLLDKNTPQLFKKYISPKQVIATHISPRIQIQELQYLKNTYPTVHFLATLEEQIQL
ncbi:MBL fold metallo-hydrolase [Aquimarina sp. M1]